jgi:DNA mismatch endonuclease (patch repair protein)
MMSSIRGRDTKPELVVRKLLFSAGYRYRLHRKDLPGKPDMVLPKHRVAIHIHGCFWHGHADCRLFRIPKSREEFWKTKIGSNITRDQKTGAELTRIGWRNLIVWECAIKGSGRLATEDLLSSLTSFIESSSSSIEIRGSV